MVILWTHQSKAVTENHPRWGHFIFTGGGKSLILKELAKANTFSLLCLTPKSLKLKWEQEISDIPHIDKTVMTPYYFKRDWDKLPYYEAIIIDEADSPWAGKNHSSKALLKYLKKHNPTYVWLATATPYRSDPINVYNLGLICGYCPYNFPTFREKFYFQQYFGAQPIWTPKLKHPKAEIKAQTQAELNEYLRNFGDIVMMEDVFDVPEIIYSVEPIEQTQEQVRTITRLDAVSENRSTFFRYVNEIENGYLDVKAIGEQLEVASNKIERVVELAEQNDVLVIFSNYRYQQVELIKALNKKFPKAYIQLVNGDNSDQAVPISKEMDLIAQGIHSKYTQGYMVVTPSVSAGWEVKYCRMAVYASLPWSYQAWIQSKGRILRSDNLKKTVYRVLESGDVDKRIYQSLCDGFTYDPARHKE